MMYKFLLIGFFFLSFFQLQAQKDANSFYQNELVLGGGLHTRGFNLSGKYVFSTQWNKAWLGLVEFGELKDAKERRLTTEALVVGGNGRRSYIYGKQNNLYNLRLGGGQRLYISDRTDKTPIAIAFNYSGGFSLGMLKPYYLDLLYRSDNDGVSIRSERFSEANRYKFLEPTDINGASNSSLGWDELTIAPGLFAKGSVLFDWGPRDDIAKLLELGLSVDLFFREMDIIIQDENSFLFLNLHLNIYFGKRW